MKGQHAGKNTIWNPHQRELSQLGLHYTGLKLDPLLSDSQLHSQTPHTPINRASILQEYQLETISDSGVKNLFEIVLIINLELNLIIIQE